MSLFECGLIKLHPYQYNIDQDVEALLVRAGVDWEVFRGKTIFVTGGTGFFGVWLLCALVKIKALLGEELDLLVLSRSPSQFLATYPEYNFSDHIRFIQGDIQHGHWGVTGVTHLVHMAATSASETFAGEDQLNKLAMLYRGTQHVLEECAGTLESVLFTSSGVAYGVHTREVLSEDDFSGLDTTELGSALGLGKLVAEYLVRYYAHQHGYQFTIARCFAFAGQYLPLDLHYAFGNFVRQALSKQPIVITGDGQDHRSYLYIGDAIAWLLKMLSCPSNQVCNVGSTHAISIRKLGETIAQRVQPALELTILGQPKEVGNFQRRSYIPSSRKRQIAYPNLEEWTSLEEIIDKMLAVK